MVFTPKFTTKAPVLMFQEMLDKTYLANSDCGFRLSNYHHETDSLINEAISSPSRDCSGENLTMPVIATHRGASPSLDHGTTSRVRHTPGKVNHIPVGPASLDLPDFFERRPDGHDSNVGVVGFETVPRKKKEGCEKKLSFADQISVRIRDKHVDPSQVGTNRVILVYFECMSFVTVTNQRIILQTTRRFFSIGKKNRSFEASKLKNSFRNC